MKAIDLSVVEGTEQTPISDKINSKEIKVTLRYDANGKRCSKDKAKTERTLTSPCSTPNAEELSENEINSLYDSAFAELSGDSKESPELIQRRAIVALYSAKFRQSVRNALISTPKPKDAATMKKNLEANVDSYDAESIKALQDLLASKLAAIQSKGETPNA